MLLRWLLSAVCLQGTSLLAEMGFAQVKVAKAATVLIEAKAGESYGSGFCIDGEGYVVTNHHVVEGAAKKVRVVLHPGEPGQETVQAEILRKDKDMDLALLRLPAVKEPLVAIELGQTGKLYETAELTAFGYPFGKSLAVTQDAYPSVSVNVGKVTSLRRLADGTLREIQMDVLVNPGNSGGPVLDGDGKVVGVTVSGIPGSGVNFAIPVDRLRAFLAVPDLVISPVPEVSWDQRFTPVTLRIQAKSLVPATGKVECQVSLSAASTERPMAVTEVAPGREWSAVAPLLDPPIPDGPLKVQIETKDATIIATIPNRPIGCDSDSLPKDRRWELRELEEIVPGKSLKCQAGLGIAADGMKITGLAPLVVRVAGQALTIPVQQVSSLRVLDKELTVRAVNYRVAFTLDGQELTKATGSISISPSPWSAARKAPPLASLEEAIAPGKGTNRPERVGAVSPAPAPDEPAGGEGEGEGEGGTRELKLPARFTDCVRAGGGRYLLLPMPTLNKLAVLDLAKRAISGYVPLFDANALVAGGGRCLFVANRTSGLIDRWTLDPLERDRRVSMPIAGTLYSLTMGAGGDGPLLAIHSSGSSIIRTFLDAQSIAPMEVETRQVNTYHPQYPPNIRAADCGTVFGAWVSGLSPSGLEVYSLVDGKLTSQREHTSVGHVLPGPNGEYVYSGTGGVYTSTLVPVADCPRDVRCYIPSSHPAYYLGLAMAGPQYMRGGETRISVYVHGLSTPVLTLPPNKAVAAVNVTMDRGSMSFEKRYHLVPQYHVLAILPSACDNVIIQGIDIEQSLRDREIDFLFVESTPPTRAKKGTSLRYQISACTSAKALSYRLDAGPEGMTVSPTGEITWDVPEAIETVGGIIVTIETDDGQTLFHTFNLKIVP